MTKKSLSPLFLVTGVKTGGIKEIRVFERLLNACTCNIESKMLKAKIRALELNLLGNKKITYHKQKADYWYKKNRVTNKQKLITNPLQH